MTSKCKQQQEGDEMACSCGLRWDVHEEDPHESSPKLEHTAAADSYSSIFSLTGCYNE